MYFIYYILREYINQREWLVLIYREFSFVWDYDFEKTVYLLSSSV